MKKKDEGKKFAGLRSGSGAKGGRSAERGAAESVSHGNRRAAVEQVTRRSSTGNGVREKESNRERNEANG